MQLTCFTDYVDNYPPTETQKFIRIIKYDDSDSDSEDNHLIDLLCAVVSKLDLMIISSRATSK